MSKTKNWMDAVLPQKVSRARAFGGKHSGRMCPYCGLSMQRPTRDHVLPKSLGNSFDGGRNKLVCCFDCNQSKANLTLPQWLIKLARNPTPINLQRIECIKVVVRSRRRAGLAFDTLPIDSSVSSDV